MQIVIFNFSSIKDVAHCITVAKLYCIVNEPILSDVSFLWVSLTVRISLRSIRDLRVASKLRCVDVDTVQLPVF